MQECDKDVYENGTTVFITNTLSSKQMENFVQKVSKKSNQKVDWHFVGGRAVVLTTGDINIVRNSILNLRKIHDNFFKKEMLESFSEEETNKVCDGIWKYNGF